MRGWGVDCLYPCKGGQTDCIFTPWKLGRA